jgi:hypothetical protein
MAQTATTMVPSSMTRSVSRAERKGSESIVLRREMNRRTITLAWHPAVSPQKEDKVREREVNVDVLEVEEDGEQRGARAQVVLQGLLG